MDRSGTLELRAQVGHERRREHGTAVLLALSTPDQQDSLVEVEILDPQAETFRHAQAGPVKQREVHPHGSFALSEHSTNLVGREDHGKPTTMRRSDDWSQLAEIVIEDVAIQEEQCAERLILGRRADATSHGQVGHKGVDFDFAELLGMPFSLPMRTSDWAGCGAECGTLRDTRFGQQSYSQIATESH